ncbi:MAG: regulatory protein RecX [bacterium]
MQDKRTDPDYQAQAILSRRDHSIFEVQTKMKRKGFTASQINSAVAKLKKLKLLDDRLFAYKCSEEILRFKAVGPHLIAHKLKQKGIDQTLIDETVAAAFADNREIKLARAAAARWQQLHPRHAADHARLTRFLNQRGFTAAIARSVLLSAGE